MTRACCRWSLAVRGGGGCKGRATLTCAKKGTALVHHFVNRGRGGSATRTDLPVFSLHESLSLMQIVAQSTIPKSTSAPITIHYGLFWMKRHEGKVSFDACWFIPTLKAIVHNTPQLSYFFVLVVPFSQKNLSQSITLLRRQAAVRTNSPKGPTLPPEIRGKSRPYLSLVW